eukprot:1267692-Amorphochlora_amoeboformis.AAC.1
MTSLRGLATTVRQNRRSLGSREKCLRRFAGFICDTQKPSTRHSALAFRAEPHSSGQAVRKAGA